jgi:hypothetical protein
LFGYVAEDGSVVDVKSDDVNAYLRAAAGEEFSAKDFRTWAGTVLAALSLAAEAAQPEHRHTKKNLAAVVKRVAERLGNTPSVCRKCYIHPAVMDAYLAGKVVPAGEVPGEAFAGSAALSASEEAVLAFLERQAKEPARSLTEQLERSVRAAAPRRAVGPALAAGPRSKRRARSVGKRRPDKGPERSTVGPALVAGPRSKRRSAGKRRPYKGPERSAVGPALVAGPRSRSGPRSVASPQITARAARKPTSPSRGSASMRRSDAATRKSGRDPRASRIRAAPARTGAIRPERPRAAAR